MIDMPLSVARSIPAMTSPQDRHKLAQSMGYTTVDAMIEDALTVVVGATCHTCGAEPSCDDCTMIPCLDWTPR